MEIDLDVGCGAGEGRIDFGGVGLIGLDLVDYYLVIIDSCYC